MTSVDSNFNFLCGRPHGAGPPPHPCERHKWMAPKHKICPKLMETRYPKPRLYFRLHSLGDSFVNNFYMLPNLFFMLNGKPKSLKDRNISAFYVLQFIISCLVSFCFWL